MIELFETLGCRLCASELTEQCVEIFDVDGVASKISEIILQHFGIEVLIDDESSHRICSPCWTITDNFHSLFNVVRQSDAKLAAIVGRGFVETADEVAAKYCKTEMHGDGASLAVTNVYTIKSVDGGRDGSPGIEYLHEIKDELGDQITVDLIGANRSETANTVDVIDDVDEENGNEDEDDDDNVDRFSEDSATEQPSSPGRTARKTVDDTERIDNENALIRQYYDMNCTLCSDSFGTLHEAIRHYRRRHQQAGFLSCCGKKVYRRCMALDHIEKHQNPERHRCPHCNKVYTNQTTLRSHMKRHEAEAAGESPRSFVCDQCPEQCATQTALAKHKRLEHNEATDRPFGCDICGKFFSTKSVLSNHVRGVHENAYSHMCHICAKTFKSKQVYDLHQRDHLETEQPKLQCNICGNWLKHEHSLRKHMARHGQTEEKCKLCNKVAPNRHALGNHMRYVHSERSYKCTMCEKAFKKAIGLKEHMASHMGVDLYFCPYCPKTFKSNANMHSHRKKKHLALWQHDRDQRQKP